MNLGGWRNWHFYRDNICGKETEVHLVPDDDYRPHEAEETCWCKPVETEPGQFSHNAMDGREAYEEGRKLQ